MMFTKKAMTVMLWIGAALVVATSVRTTLYNRELVKQVAGYQRTVELPVGAHVPSITGLDQYGKSVVMNSATEDKPVLVVVFSASCAVCDETWPSWQGLIAAHQGRNGKVMPIDITALSREDFRTAHGIANIPVLMKISPESMLSYRFRFTPQTLVLQGDSIVAGWTGALSKAQVARADSLLGKGTPSGHLATTLSATQNEAISLIRPVCDGLPCAKDSECGSKCTCGPIDPATGLGICAAKKK